MSGHPPSVLSRWYELANRIQIAEQPDNPTLIQDYLDYGRDKVTPLDPPARYQILLRECVTLLGGATRQENPHHWRRWCLDCLHRPLLALQRCARSQAEREQAAQLFVTFIHSNHSV